VMNNVVKQEWNIAATVAFVMLLLLSFALIGGWEGRASFFSLNLLDLVLIALATFRLAHLLTFDKIFDFVRDYFLNDGAKPRWGFRRLVAELLECPWCTGIWSAVIALTLYLVHDFGAFVVLVFAIAGVASILQLVCSSLAKR
jgi:hypothetical protein